MRDDSIVEMVVVGEDSVDSKVEVESRRANGFEKLENRLVWVRTGDCVATACPSLTSSLSGPSPKTDMKEGKEASSDCELVDTGIIVP